MSDDLNKDARFRLAAFLNGIVVSDPDCKIIPDKPKVFAPVMIDLDERLHPHVVRWLFARVLKQYEAFYAAADVREEAEFFAELQLD